MATFYLLSLPPALAGLVTLRYTQPWGNMQGTENKLTFYNTYMFQVMMLNWLLLNELQFQVL